VLFKAEWTAAQINELPDSAFAVIEPGGEKDDSGKTVPRSLRHLPFKGPDGKIDLAHLRNALSRLPQTDLSAELKAKARAKLQAAAREAGVGEDTQKADSKCQKCGTNVKASDKFCASCGAEVQKAAEAAEERQMAENVEQIKKLQDDLKAATDLADEEAKKREAVEKSLKEQGATIEALKKDFADAQAAIRKAEDEARLAKFKKTVDAFEHLPVKADVFAPILMKCAAALDEAGYAELMRVLKASDAANASAFREFGAPGFATKAGQPALDEINAKVAELEKSGIKKAEALVRVMTENPKLAERARRESYTVGHVEAES
jgi:hypothetical protein